MATMTITLDNDKQIEILKLALESTYDMVKDDLMYNEIHTLLHVKVGETKCIDHTMYKKVIEAMEGANATITAARALLEKVGIEPW